MKLAPVVVFAYGRPRHLQQTLCALKKNELSSDSILYIYVDAPKHLALASDVAAVEEVRMIARSEKWCKEVHVIEALRNKGLVTSFVHGISVILEKYGKGIFLEEDQVTSKGFLKFMNEALDLYEDDDRVMHVSGYMYPVDYRGKESTLFLNVQSCPGWGTWKRAWAKYNHDAVDHYNYFRQSKRLRKQFDIEGHAYFFNQLKRNAEGSPELYSWAVRWYASCLRAGGLSLFPAKSLVKNIGCDNTGEHCTDDGMYEVETVDYVTVRKIPVVENVEARKSIDCHYKTRLRKRWIDSIKRTPGRLKQMLIRFMVSLLRPLRCLIRYAYPELQQLDVELANHVGLLSSAYKSTVSSKARIKRPYHLNNVTVGDYSYIMPNSWVSLCEIGRFCSIGPGLACGAGIHPTEGISTAPMFYSIRRQNGTTLSGINKCMERKKVLIGNDVFVGANVSILDGVTIGDGAVIGAGCIVSKDVPPYAVAVGCPMKILRYRFDEETKERLLRIRWWNWPEEKLQEVEKEFFNVVEFARKYDPGVEEVETVNSTIGAKTRESGNRATEQKITKAMKNR